MIPPKSLLALVSITWFGVSCAVAQDTPISIAPPSCTEAAEAVLAQLVGDWTLAIEADEGWTGYGESFIRWSDGPACGVEEVSDAVFNQESETPLDTQSTAMLFHDALSDTLKVMTTESRGYVHLGFSADASTLAFEIGRFDIEPATRRILYRDFSADGFEWVWQGRTEESDDWADRLMIRYTRAD